MIGVGETSAFGVKWFVEREDRHKAFSERDVEGEGAGASPRPITEDRGGRNASKRGVDTDISSSPPPPPEERVAS